MTDDDYGDVDDVPRFQYFINWTDRVRYEVLRIVKDERHIVHAVKRR